MTGGGPDGGPRTGRRTHRVEVTLSNGTDAADWPGFIRAGLAQELVTRVCERQPGPGWSGGAIRVSALFREGQVPVPFSTISHEASAGEQRACTSEGADRWAREGRSSICDTCGGRTRHGPAADRPDGVPGCSEVSYAGSAELAIGRAPGVTDLAPTEERPVSAEWPGLVPARVVRLRVRPVPVAPTFLVTAEHDQFCVRLRSDAVFARYGPSADVVRYHWAPRIDDVRRLHGIQSARLVRSWVRWRRPRAEEADLLPDPAAVVVRAGSTYVYRAPCGLGDLSLPVGTRLGILTGQGYGELF